VPSLAKKINQNFAPKAISWRSKLTLLNGGISYHIVVKKSSSSFFIPHKSQEFFSKNPQLIFCGGMKSKF